MPAANATESRFEIQTDDATAPDKLDSTHATTIIGANILSMPVVDVINSPMLDKAASLSTANVLIMICLSAAAIVTINSAVRVVMNFNQWAAPLVWTVMRSGYDFACLIKVLTCMTASFLTQFSWATVTDMPTNIKQQARRARTRRMRSTSRELPRGRRGDRRSRMHVDVCMMMTRADGYDSRKFECCQPYHARRQG